MAVTTALKKIFLRWAKQQATTQSLPLKDALLSLAGDQINEVVQGKILISVSTPGATSTFTPASFGRGVSNLQIVEMASELIDLYDLSEGYLKQGGNAAPNEDEVYAEMLGLLVPCTEQQGDFAGLRYPPSVTAT